ncbi:carbohydrate sulfotransferase 11 [Drosophila albomicans]|uniref:Carbohydrate sulfotransferase n=1 Tax=Drosophila albomicans TaxID=7291 RepID=A0A6P8WM92_DROAB|nr:carbohydrate sulfotransferase 11 [Drosophila albomicans]XP_034100415.1 carbohydrate sulfotransferase 11 [Drosophila albomicans]XP_034100416.1 carbohydrate sulfotransferase 11 [Drosophila albomicans]XP_034100417.1 carbohydrate sulfotransferase 11 [Drosophila albomicans]
MQIRLRSGRRLHAYLKIGTCVLVGVCYFAFLFRESLNAFEHRERATAAVALEAAEYSEPSKQQLKLKRQQSQRQRLLDQKRLDLSRANGTSSMARKTTAAPASTLNPVYEYSEELHSRTERDLKLRRDHLATVCERYKLQEKYPPNPWEFFISPGHNNLVWCNVFKAASSTWMYYFNILAGYDLKYLQRTEVQPLELARQRFPRPELAELLELLPSALSFLFVRDPFERILSAYRNKLEGNRNSFYKALGTKIVHRFRRRSMGGPWPRCGPTFEEFVRFLIKEHKAGRRFDEHWAPVYSFCTPCSVNFSIIGKTETFQRDSEFIIRQAGLESLLLGKLPRRKLRKIGNLARSGIKSEALVERYFADLDRTTLDQLLKIYRIDFELFDYDFLKYYDMVHPWSLEQSTQTARTGTGTGSGSATGTGTGIGTGTATFVTTPVSTSLATATEAD